MRVWLHASVQSKEVPTRRERYEEVTSKARTKGVGMESFRWRRHAGVATILGLTLIISSAGAAFAQQFDPAVDELTEVKGDYKIGLSMSYFGNGWQTENQYAAQALTQLEPYKDHVELIVAQSGPDVQKQNAQLNQMIAEGVDAIIGFAISPEGLNRTIKAACDEGIVVVLYSGGVTETCAHFVGVDYALQGKVMAEWLAEAMGGEGNIYMNHGVAGTGPATLRDEAAKAVFAEYPDLSVVAEANGDWSAAVSQTAAAQALAAHPDIDGVWSEAGSDGVVRAMQAQGLALVPTTGEGTNGWHRMLVDEELAAAGLTGMSTADAAFDAPLALKLAVAALEGYDIPQQYIIPVPTVYQEMPAEVDPGEAATTPLECADATECNDIAAGYNVFPEGLFPDDYFVSFYFKGLPQLTLNAYVTGTP
jgi:ribose transport system substrate-binding protein